MQFKTDENLPLEVAELLRATGHDALTIHDQQLMGHPDPSIAKVCRLENRALITLDLDFADIRSYVPGDYSGIIVLRPQTLSKPRILSLAQRVLNVLNSEPLLGKLWIVEESSLRIRG